MAAEILSEAEVISASLITQIPNLFLWIANFADGTQIFQDETDISRTHIPTEEETAKNQFFDVLQYQNISPLISFLFRSVEENGNIWAVDLRDGHFELNGVSFLLHREELGEHYSDFRLIQARRVEHLINQKTNEILKSNLYCYVLGWQTTFQGKNEQRVIKIVQ